MKVQESLQVCAVYTKLLQTRKKLTQYYKSCVLCLNVNKIGGSHDKIKATQAHFPWHCLLALHTHNNTDGNKLVIFYT